MLKKLTRQLVQRGTERLSFEARRDFLVADAMLLQAAAATRQIRVDDRPKSLRDVELRVFSQWGEDGIIEWLVSHLDGIPASFVEFGVEDYVEANTRYLLHNRNWRGLVLDGSAEHIDSIRKRPEMWRHDLTAECLFITTDNIDSAIANAGFVGDIGVLSIDIDGNDYWVLQAIKAVRPWIIVCEYNAIFGDTHALTVPYVADFRRFAAHYSGIYFGASLPAFEHLLEPRGYTLVGGNMAGSNAFFVRNDVVGQLNGYPTDRRARPSRLREARGSDGTFTFASGTSRIAPIGDLPVVDVTRESTAPLASFAPLYSEAWRLEMDGRA